MILRTKKLRTCCASGRGKAALQSAILASAVAWGTSASATVYTWDANGSASGTGGTGTWNTSSALFTSDGTNYIPWSSANANTDSVLFAGTAGTVTLGAAVGANGLTFGAAGYNISGSSKLTLSGTSPTIDTGGNNETFGMAASDLGFTGATGNSIIKKGVGVLSILNDQSGTISSVAGTATWNISGGTQNTSTGQYTSDVAIYDGKELGASGSFSATLNGGMISFLGNGGAGLYSGRTINVTASGGAIWDGGFAPGQGTGGNNGGNTISPAINIAAGNGLDLVSTDLLLFDTGNNGSGAGVISGAGGINIYGTAGMVEILSTGHTYTGGTSIMPGASLLIGGASSLGNTSASGYTLSNGGNLYLNGASVTVTNLTNNNGGSFKFKFGTSTTVNNIAATNATWTGNSAAVQFDSASTAPALNSSFTLISSTNGGLGSAIFQGSQYLNTPSSTELVTINGTTEKMTLSTTGTQIKVTTSAPPSKTIVIMPLGASITAGVSAQANYNGDGYRSGLFQDLVNDGRFNPQFVGSQTSNEANGPTGTDLMTVVGQTHNEGHPGYTGLQIDQNLTSGGDYLTPGNGVNPDYITLNVGGNDLAQNAGPALTLSREDQLLTDLNTDRPNATTIVSDVLYRVDATTSDVNTTNAGLPAVVYAHVLAGQHLEFFDWNSLVNFPADFGPDGIHPTQAGYNKLADGWYNVLTHGQAFFTGADGSTWSATSGSTTSFDMDYARTTDSGVVPSSITDVYFNGAGTNTTLGANFSIRSLNFTAAATSSVTVGGANTLTIGQGGITVQAGTGAHTVSSAVALNGTQTWGNISANKFTVSGNVSGAGPLTIEGSSAFVLSGNNSYTGGTSLTGGTLYAMNSTGSATGTGALTVSPGATLTGNGIISGLTTVQGTITAGTLATNSIATLTTAGELWSSAGTFAVDVATNGLSSDQLIMSSLFVGATSSSKFNVSLADVSPTVVPAGNPLVLATVDDATSADPFYPSTFSSLTKSELAFSMSNLNPTSGYAFSFTTAPALNGSGQTIGYSLVLSQTAVPEPATVSLGLVAAAGLLRRRRRR